MQVQFLQVEKCRCVAFVVWGTLLWASGNLAQGERAAVLAQRIDYARQIRPLLADNCLACHGPDSAQRQADLRLDIKAESIRRSAVVPGNPAASALIQKITAAQLDERMPPAKSGKVLLPEQIELLRQWIAEGAEWPEHWAFQPPIPVSPPDIASTWALNEIDRFVWAELSNRQLRPSPDADDLTLLRRLHFDLTGLPPTPNAIDQFERLRLLHPETAFDRELDRLLASPHYGERMALDWLDLARFGDTNGYQDDALRPAWPYRDQVIETFNRGQSFDQFTIEQLAGDLLPNATRSQRIATGFNRLHRQNEEGGSDPEEFRVVYAVDRTNTTATTWMGLTLACAQCHDHKYDPLSQTDYYRLLAFFNSLKGENILTKNPRNNPPQLLVPNEQQAGEMALLQGQQHGVEQELASDEPRASAAFDDWLRSANLSPDQAIADHVLVGAAGGTIGTVPSIAYYADAGFRENLKLDQPITASGTLNVFRFGKHDVRVGHFLRGHNSPSQFIGLAFGEGPKAWAQIGLANGKVVVSDSMPLKLGTEYQWSYEWNPLARELRLEVIESNGGVRNRLLSLDIAQVQEPSQFDGFGIVGRGDGPDHGVSEVYVGQLDYNVSRDTRRSQSFAAASDWIPFGGDSGNGFGWVKGISTSDAPPASGMSIRQLLDIPVAQRTEQHRSELKAFFLGKIDARRMRLLNELTTIKKRLTKLESSIPQALVWEDQFPPRPAHVLKRGDFQQPGAEVTRGAPSIFRPLVSRQPASLPDRLDLARWLVSPDHPLTARVAANRLWKQCFGHGIVRTMEDFGIQGEPPTHPQLLDWLALNFVSDHWDVKRLQRRMFMSATYRQSSYVTAVLNQRDAANRLWTRSARLRLAAEEIRDMALSVSGLLETQIGGPSVHPRQPRGFYQDKSQDWSWPEPLGANLYRRGLYTFIRRTTLYPSLATFDAPQRGECTVNRPRTNTPLQALVTLNDPVFVEAARAFAQRILTDGGEGLIQKMTFAFRATLTRSPEPKELKLLQELYDSTISRYQADGDSAQSLLGIGSLEIPKRFNKAELATWTVISNTLLNLDEAITRE